MAYHTKRRDPLLDEATAAVIERRGKEVAGLLLLAAAALLGAALGSYSPADPGWLAVGDGEVRNWLGRIGARLASPLHVMLGHACLLIPIALMVWGLRLFFHRGAERLAGRIASLPVAVVVLAVHLAGLVPPDGWGRSTGLGGHAGDTFLGALLGVLPLPMGAGFRAAVLLTGIGAVIVALHATGFSRAELRAILRRAWVSLILCYNSLAGVSSQAAGAAVRGGTDAARGLAERRAAATRARAAVEAEPDDIVEADDESEPVPSLRGLVRGLARRPITEETDHADADGPSAEDRSEDEDDRLRARIGDAIRARRRPRLVVGARRPEPPVTGPKADPHVRAEPPLTAGAAAAAAGGEVAIAAVRRRLAEGGARAAGAVAGAVADGTTQLDDPRPVIRSRTAAGAMESGGPHAEGEGDGALAFEAAPATLPTFTSGRIARPDPLAGDDDDDDDDDDHDDGLALDEPASRRTPPAGAKRAAAPAVAAAPESPDYDRPPLDLLRDPGTVERYVLPEDQLEENARILEGVLDDYGVKGEIVSVRPGPVVTMYELEPAPGVKASRVVGLSDDIARSMSALSARVSTVPGRSVIGIELPNDRREMCVLREILEAPAFGKPGDHLPLALGKDIGGTPVVANLAKMPHLLIAGTTGSGKSVAINTMILSLLYKLTPEECRLIMIDPKMLELSVYDGIPHLLSPVVTDPKKAVVALKWVVGEMEDRYKKMAKMGVRNIAGYNGRVKEALARGESFSRTFQTGFDDDTGDPVFETEEFTPEALPYIVVVVDEMADLMMVAGKEIEACIQRLAQMARASGIHLIMATQRPSVDVITGTIKANFPTRISFQVTSKIDSRTILGEMGAEQLLGQGDMLYMAGGAKITRVHGPFCSDEEVEEIVAHLKTFGPPQYVGSVQEGPEERPGATSVDEVLGLAATGGPGSDEERSLYDQAVDIVARDRKCSTSYIQRKLGIGYNKAARLVEQMEDEGVVTAANHVGKREILVRDPSEGV